MDFGATWCTSRKPVCLSGARKCPFEQHCQANLSNQVLALPKKVVKAKSPEFDCDMLLMRHGDFVLLHKRPDKAIWGGLWSLPESIWRRKVNGELGISNLQLMELLQLTLPKENISTILQYCAVAICGEKIRHIFTHRRLGMQIWHVNVQHALPFSNPHLMWVPLRQLGRYGLPQPIKILLLELNLVRGDELRN
jgi:A/G-specific adenine glycosylase